MLEIVAFSPHPPIVIPEVGKEETSKVITTYKGMQKLAKEITEINPELIVAVTPHGHVFSDVLTITGLKTLQGDLAGFGAPEVKVEFSSAEKEIQVILEECRKNYIECVSFNEKDYAKFKLSKKLDHGLVVPLSFLYRSGWRGKLVPINIAFFSYEKLYHFGKVLSEALDNLNISWVLLASADLSHRLHKGAPAGYSPRGAVFDELVRQSIREGDVKRLLNIEPSLVEEAGECGLRPIVIALGALDGYAIEAEELAYEGPFGVGYMIARLKRGPKVPERELIASLYQTNRKKAKDRIKGESLPVSLARQSLRKYLATREVIKISENAGDLLKKKAGAFVSLKKQGNLRGCIGTIEPTRSNLAEEIIYNAISAAIHDPRFAPVSFAELEQVTISVDVLEKPERVDSLRELDPKVYGVIVSCGRRRGLLLPDLPGVDTPEEQVAIARAKAGINPEEKVVLERFKVTRYN
ncbi:MAG: AmmeMemoRadiSam system protein A [Peptococcia bacterium]|jgi:AmmeMemoRadiSam system protein A